MATGAKGSWHLDGYEGIFYYTDIDLVIVIHLQYVWLPVVEYGSERACGTIIAVSASKAKWV